MVFLTKAQRKALKRVYDRGSVWPIRRGDSLHTTANPDRGVGKKLTYRQFRKRVQVCFDGSGAIAIHWAGMWLLIEKDGYTHS